MVFCVTFFFGFGELSFEFCVCSRESDRVDHSALVIEDNGSNFCTYSSAVSKVFFPRIFKIVFGFWNGISQYFSNPRDGKCAGTFCWSTITFGASNDLICFFVFRKDPLELSQIPMAYHHFPLRFDKHKLG